MSLIRELRKMNRLDPHTSALLDDLRAVGNVAAHSTHPEPTLEEARRYRETQEDYFHATPQGQIAGGDAAVPLSRVAVGAFEPWVGVSSATSTSLKRLEASEPLARRTQ